MKTAIILVGVLLFATSALADDLSDAAAICEHHVSRFPPRPWEPDPDHEGKFRQRPTIEPMTPEWAHCVGILKASDLRAQKQREADEASNPELKSTRDLAKRLKGQN